MRPLSLLALAVLAGSLAAQILSPIVSGGPRCCTYYVDPSGSDAANGLTPATAWQHISKVNAATLTAGQSVGFKRGGTWRETLTVPASGVIFAPYGSGAAPIITGADLATGWTASTGETGGIFIADAETGNTSQLTSVTTAGTSTFASTASYIHGAKGFTVTSDGSNLVYATKTFAGQSTAYVRFYLYIPSTFSQAANYNYTYLMQGLAGATPKIDVYLQQQAGTWAFTGQMMFGSYANFATTITTDAVHLVEMKYVSAAGTGGAQFWLDGASVGSNFSQSNAGTNLDSVRIGYIAQNVPSAGASMVFDDLKVATSGPIGAYTPGAPANTYQVSQATTPLLVLQDGGALTSAASVAALTAGHWFYGGASPLYSILTGSDDPSGHTMEVGARQFAVNMNRKAGVVLSGITLTGTPGVATSVPLNDVAAWGDSLTYGTGGGGTTYPGVLATATGRTVYNGGVAGETSTQIKTRMLAGTTYKDDFAVIWAGRNNFSDCATIRADITAMVASLPNPKRFLVLSVLNGDYNNTGVDEEWSGHSGYVAITGCNGYFASDWPSNYLDIRALLVAQFNAGIPQDVADHGHDVPPSSLRSDSLHLNAAGYTYVANQIAAWIAAHD